MILLDTDILTLLLAGHDKVKNQMADAEEAVAITLITRIEVLQDRFAPILKAANGTQLEQAMARLTQSELALSKFELISIDTNVTTIFDKLRKNKKLKKIGRADMLIACIALAHKATLVTRNLKHFKQVPGLTVDNWAD